MGEDEPTPLPAWPHGHSLLYFSRDSSTRQLCTWILAQTWFDNIIIVAILASTACLALDSPRLDPVTSLAQALVQLNYLWTWLFFAEMLIKVISLGFTGSDQVRARGYRAQHLLRPIATRPSPSELWPEAH